MAATAGHRLTLNPMGKCSNAFFSETTKDRNLIFGMGRDANVKLGINTFYPRGAATPGWGICIKKCDQDPPSH
jgi:hypothetical protein